MFLHTSPFPYVLSNVTMVESLTIPKIDLSFSLKVFSYVFLVHTLLLKTVKPDDPYDPSMTYSVLYSSKPLSPLVFGLKPFSRQHMSSTSDQPKRVHFIHPFSLSSYIIVFVSPTPPPPPLTNFLLAHYHVFISDPPTITRALDVSIPLLDVFLSLVMSSSTKILFHTPTSSHLRLLLLRLPNIRSRRAPLSPP